MTGNILSGWGLISFATSNNDYATWRSLGIPLTFLSQKSNNRVLSTTSTDSAGIAQVLQPYTLNLIYFARFLCCFFFHFKLESLNRRDIKISCHMNVWGTLMEQIKLGECLLLMHCLQGLLTVRLTSSNIQIKVHRTILLPALYIIIL